MAMQEFEFLINDFNKSIVYKTECILLIGIQQYVKINSGNKDKYCIS